MHFAVTCFDKEDALELRMANRDAHLVFVRSDAIMVIAGGPMFNDNDKMCGSHLLIEADDRAHLDAILATDPYVVAGLFEKVVIQKMKVVIQNPV